MTVLLVTSCIQRWRVR